MDIKEKTPIVAMIKKDIASTKRALWLCIQRKAEMTYRDWEAVIQGKKMYGEWKEFKPFPRRMGRSTRVRRRSGQFSAKASNDSEEEVESKRDKKNLLI